MNKFQQIIAEENKRIKSIISEELDGTEEHIFTPEQYASFEALASNAKKGNKAKVFAGINTLFDVYEKIEAVDIIMVADKASDGAIYNMIHEQ